ncbi:unnamed protein product [Cylicocyclus nassatus]|uniref:Uncharacterized protein n=1 Tax=Cylicocyclus nassatus TaxID=53992 RepID=A0AA36DM56_CYLNA|nr:unnamed protein product [Cylicocyclus nassatus]
MSDIPSVAATLKSILSPENNLDSAISNALMALGVALDKLTHRYDKAGKEIELVRRMTRTGWLMAINVPLPFGVTKCQALQQLLGKFDYCKPLFDSERDLICSEISYVNRGGCSVTCLS